MGTLARFLCLIGKMYLFFMTVLVLQLFLCNMLLKAGLADGLGPHAGFIME
jgi:hypothetical protein